MKEDKTLEDEYSILNIHKNDNETALDWKSYNKNTEPTISKSISKNITILKNESIQELKDSILRIQKEKPDIENISYKRYKQSQMKDNVFQKENLDSFHIEEIDLSDLKFNDEIENKEGMKKEIKNNESEIKEIENKEIKNNGSEIKTSEIIESEIEEIKNNGYEIKESENEMKKSIDPKIQNILKERLSNVLTPRALIKTNINPHNIVDQHNSINHHNLVDHHNIINQTSDIVNPFKNSYIAKEQQVNLSINSTIKQVALNTVKRKLEEEISKNSKCEKTDKPELGKIDPNGNILEELKLKLQNEVKLRKEILNLETTIRLQKLEIDMLRNRELPKNNSKELIQECKNAICNIRKELKNQEEEFQNDLKNERNKNSKLSKEISSLKSIINSLLVKNNKLNS